jgi:hypothetical protein
MNADGNSGRDFEALLEQELRRHIGKLQGPRPAFGQAAYRAVANGGKASMSVLPSLAAATSMKIVVAAATTALVVGGGSAAAAAATHSTNPSVWGRTVTEAVARCKSELATGEHGIGQCVSDTAQEHGEAQRAAHSQSGDHPEASPSPHGSGNGNSNGKSQSTEAASDQTSGKSSDAHGNPHASPPANGHPNNTRHS